ncbi:MAG: capsular biosynthesis protein [Rhodocyclaceae bacterium]|nr:capsular biosynthesis protein [Rhodocyclaceae bacterium]
MVNRHFVFLQGMPSPFFRRIGDALEANGYRVTRINLSFGDWLFWHGKNAVGYRGRYADWEGYIGNFFDQYDVTDLILLGEQRRYHKEAVHLAQTRGIRVTVTDFGYLRPDWIVLERDGMGGNSRFPRNPVEIIKQAASIESADLSPRYPHNSLGMVMADLSYNFGNLFLGWCSYPRYRRSDCRPETLIYTLGSAIHLLRARLGRRQSQRVVDSLIESQKRYFILPLQLDHDFQIIAYSSFSGMSEVIDLVITSFAKFSAPADRLVIKVHPWDAGLKNWKRIVLKAAVGQGVADRVDYLNGGSLDRLASNAVGMITVNSTSGLHAVQVGCPVKVLGQAVYDVPGLTFQGTLDDFWRAPLIPDPALLTAFINLMAAKFHVRGIYFDDPGCFDAAKAAVDKLLSEM